MRSSFFAVMFLAVGLLPGPCGAALAQSAETLADQARASELAFARSLQERDREAFAGFIAPDARFFGGPQVHVGPEEILAAWSRYFEEGGPRLSWEPAKVEANPERGLAVSTGPYTLEIPAGDGTEAQTLKGTFFSVWERTQGGAWQIIFDTGTAPTPADEPQ